MTRLFKPLQYAFEAFVHGFQLCAILCASSLLSLPKAHQALNLMLSFATPSFKRVPQIISQRETCWTSAHFHAGYVSSRIQAITVWHLLFPTRQTHYAYGFASRLAYLTCQEHIEVSTFHDDEFMRLGTY
jgi:hypothetical protein